MSGCIPPFICLSPPFPPIHRFPFWCSFGNLSHRPRNLWIHRLHLICAAGRGLWGRTPTLAGFSGSERFPPTLPFCFSHPPVSGASTCIKPRQQSLCLSYRSNPFDLSLSSPARTSSTHPAPRLCRRNRERSWRWGERTERPVSIRACWLVIPQLAYSSPSPLPALGQIRRSL